MKAKVLKDLILSGKKPEVQLTDCLWDDSWGEKHMIAEVTKVIEDMDGWNFTFDYTKFKSVDLPLQAHNWHLKDGETGTAIEAGLVDENNLAEDVIFAEDAEVPVELIGNETPLAEYLKSGFTGSYVEWLEKIAEELIPDCMKPWKKGI